jgi:hypothetical protein
MEEKIKRDVSDLNGCSQEVQGCRIHLFGFQGKKDLFRRGSHKKLVELKQGHPQSAGERMIEAGYATGVWVGVIRNDGSEHQLDLSRWMRREELFNTVST